MKELKARANSSLNNKTGSWRTHKPVIDYNKCIGCGLCAKICPEGCIAMKNAKKDKNGKPIINYSLEEQSIEGCGYCLKKSFYFDKVISCVEYTNLSKKMIFGLKS